MAENSTSPGPAWLWRVIRHVLSALNPTSGDVLTWDGSDVKWSPSSGGPAGAGPSGPPGFMGEDGAAGEPGPPGPQGAAGSAGSPGPAGAIGSPGPAGEDGPAGESGPPGPAGAAGAQGGTGASGSVGPAVFLVAEGEEGPIGSPGPAGPQGPAGQGATGDPGPMGPAIFLVSESGDEGIMGPPGVQGPAGSGSSLLTTKKLSADLSNSTTTFAKVTNLDTAVGVGTWHFKYILRHQSAALTTGIQFCVNHTGTVTAFVASSWWAENTTAACTGAQNQAGAAIFGLRAGGSARAKSATVAIGRTISVDVIDADMLMIIEGLIVVTVAGNLELYHASEVAAASTIKAESMLVLIGPSA